MVGGGYGDGVFQAPMGLELAESCTEGEDGFDAFI